MKRDSLVVSQVPRHLRALRHLSNMRLATLLLVAWPAAVGAHVAVAVGNWGARVIRYDSVVKNFGYNTIGQLGYGDTNNRGDGTQGQLEMGNNLPILDLGTNRTPIAIYARGTHTCVLLSGGSLKCFGAAADGRLGYADTANRGDGPDEMGDALPDVSLGVGRTVIAASAGTTHTCALLDDGTVKCFGGGQSGKLGYDDTRDRGDGPNEMGDFLPAVQLGGTAVKLAAGIRHTCVILIGGDLKCFGHNYYGQLGTADGSRSNRGDDPGEMAAISPVLLGTNRTAVEVSVGAGGPAGAEATTCVILDSGGLKCFGRGTSGTLGTGDTKGRGLESGSLGDNLPEIALGTNRTAVQVPPETWGAASSSTTTTSSASGGEI